MYLNSSGFEHQNMRWHLCLALSPECLVIGSQKELCGLCVWAIVGIFRDDWTLLAATGSNSVVLIFGKPDGPVGARGKIIRSASSSNAVDCSCIRYGQRSRIEMLNKVNDPNGENDANNDCGNDGKRNR